MIKVIDNITSPANVKHLENILLNFQPWYFVQNTAYNQFEQKSNPYEPSWVHMIYNNEEAMSPLMSLTESILIKALYEADLPIKKLIRIRAGLSTRTPHSIVHPPHVDWDDEHMSGVYYVNDSDGDTVLYKEKRDPSLTVSSYNWSKDRNFTVDQKIQPKADRMVIFDGLTYHSSSTPCQNDYRIMINFNWI